MLLEGQKFRVFERQMGSVVCHRDGDLGVVKVQMPEQCSDTGNFFVIRDGERVRNLAIARSTVSTFGCWAKQVNAPAVILFPELSVCEEVADWLEAEMATTSISPNTLLVLGLEQLTLDRFIARVANSHSRSEFEGHNYGVNVDRVNTSMILAKDGNGSVFRYYQPKCSRSDYESPNQYVSDVVYKFAFGGHHLIVCICSDFFLQAEARPLIGTVMLDVDRLHPNPRDHRIDLVLLIQKNPSPLDTLYHRSVKHLFYNTPHRIVTSDTIVCAVNSIRDDDLGKFGRSTVSVMRRGRPPAEYKKKHAFEHFAWCSHEGGSSHQNDDLHYARWRLRLAGAISFVLATHPRPWPPGDLDSLPVGHPGLFRLTDMNQFESVCPCPEAFELQDVLYTDFRSFIDGKFETSSLRHYYRLIDAYELLVENLVARSPRKILGLLLALHGASVNCDHWDTHRLADAFRHFLVALRLLADRYPTICVANDWLHADAKNLGIVDCKNEALHGVLNDLADPLITPQDTDVLVLQRLSDLYPWDGSPLTLEELRSRISTSKTEDSGAHGTSVAKAPSPKIADLGVIVSRINRECVDTASIRRVLDDIL